MLAPISAQKIVAIDAEPAGDATHSSRTVSAIDRSGSGVFAFRVAAFIHAAGATRIILHGIGGDYAGRLLDEWLSDPSERLHHRMQQSNIGESCAKRRFVGRIFAIFCIVFDANRKRWWHHANTQTDGLRSTVYYTTQITRLQNCYPEEVSDELNISKFVSRKKYFWFLFSCSLQLFWYSLRSRAVARWHRIEFALHSHIKRHRTRGHIDHKRNTRTTGLFASEGQQERGIYVCPFQKCSLFVPLMY